MANYTTTSDIIFYRPDVDSYDQAYFPNYHTQATIDVNRKLEVEWYRQAATNMGIDWKVTAFNADLLLNSATQLKQAAAFRVLYYIYAALTIKTDDFYAAMRDLYEKMYNNEIESVIAQGIDYDWDESGAIDDDEKAESAPRRLYRA